MKLSPGKIIGVIVFIVVLAAFLNYGKVIKEKRENELIEKIKKLPTEKVKKGEIQIKLKELGTIAPVEKIEVKSPINGRVSKLYVDNGDYVKPGQILATIEPDISVTQRLTQITSRLKLAKANLKKAEKDYLTAKTLFNEGFISKDQLDQIELKYINAKQEYESALLDYNNYKKEGIDFNSLESSQIISKWEGVIINRKVEEGELVLSGTNSFSSGTVLFEIANLKKLLIESTINEVDIGKISLGMDVDIEVDAFPDKKYKGKIIFISPAAREDVETKAKVFDIKVSIDSEGTELKPGMSANLTIKGKKKSNVLIIPINAVFYKNDKTIVYVKRKDIDKQNKNLKDNEVDKKFKKKATADLWKDYFEEREVKLGIMDDFNVEVISGLKEGEEVALEDPTIFFMSKR